MTAVLLMLASAVIMGLVAQRLDYENRDLWVGSVAAWTASFIVFGALYAVGALR